MMAACSSEEGGGAWRGGAGGSMGLAAGSVCDCWLSLRSAASVLGPTPRLSICSTERSSSRSESLVSARKSAVSVAQLYSFIQNSIELIKQGKQSDRETADFLADTKLSDRLDDRSVEQMESLGVGPRTLAALRKLSQQSQTLPAAKPIEPPAPPRQAPPPSSEEQAAIIEDVRAYALDYSKNLPDFICTQVTRRYAAAPPGSRYGGPSGSEPSYRLQDTLTIRLSFFEQKEDYKPVLVNGQMTNQDYKSLGGTLVSGDFGTMLNEIFERQTQARFEWDHWATLRGKLAMSFASTRWTRRARSGTSASTTGSSISYPRITAWSTWIRSRMWWSG